MVPIVAMTGPALVCQPGGLPGGLAQKSLVGVPRREGMLETGTKEPCWDPQDERGYWGTARKSSSRRNPLNRCPGCRAEDLGSRLAIRLLEPLSRAPVGLPEALNGVLWGLYQKPSGAGRKRPISGPLGGWPIEGVFFSYEVCPSDSGGVLR